MQVSVENTGKLQRRLQVQIPAERVSKAITERLKSVSRTARLNGFRPGKAPLSVIRRQFGAQIEREVIGDLLQSSFAEAVTQSQLNPAGTPRIEPQSLAEGEDLTYVATFEVFPEITLAAPETLEFERMRAEVTAEDVDAMIERLRKERPTFAAVDRGAILTDRVTVDFEGSIDGVAFPGGKGENIAITLGQGRMLAQIEEGLVGARAGDAKEIPVDFPADYRAADLAGKRANFSVRVKSVETAELPELNEDFFKQLGVETGGLAKMREDVEENLKRELDQALRSRLKQIVLAKLYDANPIDVPAALVESQVQEMQVEAMRQAGIKDPAQAPAPEPYREPARRRVALGLIISEIIKREKIIVDQARVSERLNQIVASYGDAEGMLRAYRQNANAMRQIENLVLEDQVVDRILAQATVHDVPSTFKEVMRLP